MPHHEDNRHDQTRDVQLNIHPGQLGQSPLSEPESKGPKISKQEQSLFFAKFPLEIRRLIYTYTLLDEEREAGDRIRHFTVEEKHYEHHFSHWVYVNQQRGRDVPVIWGPLLTCWRMYSEAVEILYSKATFDFNSDRVFVTFVSLTPQEHLSNIKRLNINLPICLYRNRKLWYVVDHSSYACEERARVTLQRNLEGLNSREPTYEAFPSLALYQAMSKLPGLKELSIRFNGLGYQNARKENEAWDEQLLAPLLELENGKLEKLKVMTSWVPVKFDVNAEYKTKSGCSFQVAVDRTMGQKFVKLLEAILDGVV